MAITINDVAKEADVSITTVSRVMNNNYPVKKETRQKIEKAIEKLNYKPNAMARSLITKKTSTLGIVVPGITNLFFSTIVEAIEGVTKNEGYHISLCNSREDFNEEKKLVDELISRQVDGVIVIDPCIENLEDEYYEKLCMEIPIIIVNGYLNKYKCNFVCYDEEVGTREAFQYLLELGHKKIAFIRGNKSLSYDIKEKIYADILDRHQLGYKNILNLGMGNSIEVIEKEQEQLEELLKDEKRPTAIFACNDLMAVAVLHACSKMGLKVPEDLSIIGFDNTIICNITNPKLTSVDANMKEVGKRAALELMSLIQNKSKSRTRVIFDTILIVRETCVSPKACLKK